MALLWCSEVRAFVLVTHFLWWSEVPWWNKAGRGCGAHLRDQTVTTGSGVKYKERVVYRNKAWSLGKNGGGGPKGFTNPAAQEKMPIGSFPGAHNHSDMNGWNCRALYYRGWPLGVHITVCRPFPDWILQFPFLCGVPLILSRSSLARRHFKIDLNFAKCSVSKVF